ncbi:MAG: nucleoside 2-deoxyribosyltransferase [Methanimicrococcus sp.]|nr:nucleoside 2-deoxyribosyltransferase [Methanimicrococcus sp.]
MVTVYIAGALFSQAEREFNKKLQHMLLGAGFSVFLPQEDAEENKDQGDDRNLSSLFNQCLNGLKISDIVVAVLEGADIDSGTAWETGYAYAKGMPVIGFRTDFRIQAQGERVNLMIQESLSEYADSFEALEVILKKYG